MPRWQDEYRHRDAVADVGAAVDALREIVDGLPRSENATALAIFNEAVRLAGAFERLSNPRKRQDAAESRNQCLDEPKRAQERQSAQPEFAPSGLQTDDDGIDYP